VTNGKKKRKNPFANNWRFTRETPRKFKEDIKNNIKKIDNDYLKVKENQNILIFSFDTGFFALTKLGESVSVNILRQRLEKSIEKYQIAGELPHDFHIDTEIKIYRQTWSEKQFKTWNKVGDVEVFRDANGRIITWSKVE